MTVNASGTGGFGNLHAFVSATLSVAGTTSTTAYSSAEGLFEDNLTVNDAALTGEEGFLLLGYALDGTTQASGQANAYGAVVVCVGATDSPCSGQSYATSYTGDVAGAFAVPVTFTFTYGQPFGLEMILQAYGGALTLQGPSCIDECGYNPQYYDNASGTGSANFGDTLVLSSITLEGPSGSVVSGAQITSASGTQYGPDGVVPEPSSASMLAIGLSALCIGGRLISARKSYPRLDRSF